MKSTKFLMSILIEWPLLIARSHVQLILSHSKKEKLLYIEFCRLSNPVPQNHNI